jgi:hypothetical protein
VGIQARRKKQQFLVKAKKATNLWLRHDGNAQASARFSVNLADRSSVLEGFRHA